MPHASTSKEGTHDSVAVDDLGKADFHSLKLRENLLINKIVISNHNYRLPISQLPFSDG